MIIIRITLNKEMISNFFDEKANNFNTQLKYTVDKMKNGLVILYLENGKRYKIYSNGFEIKRCLAMLCKKLATFFSPNKL